MFDAANFMGRADKISRIFHLLSDQTKLFQPCKRLRWVKTNSTRKYVSKLELKFYFVKMLETIHFCYAKFDTFFYHLQQLKLEYPDHQRFFFINYFRLVSGDVQLSNCHRYFMIF